MKNEKVKKSGGKFWRNLLIGIAALIVLCILINIFASQLLNNMVKEKVVSDVNSHKKTHLQLEDVSYNIFTNTISITKPELIIRDSTKAENNLYNISAPLVKISGVNWFRLILSSGFSANELSVDDTNIKINSEEGTEEDNEGRSDNQHLINDSFIAKLPARLNPFILDKLVINSGTLTGNIKSGKESITDSVQNFSLSIKDINLNPHVYDDSLKFIYADDLEFTASKISRKYLTAGNVLSIDSVSISGDKSNIELNNLSFKPFLSLGDYFLRKAYRSDRYIINLPVAKFDNVNFRQIFWNKIYEAGNITLNNFLVDILTDKRLPPNPSTNPKMPNDIMRRLDFQIDLKSISLNNGNLFIKSLKPYSDAPAELAFTDIQGNVSNICNIMRRKTDCSIEAAADLAGAGRLKVNMDLPLLSESLNFKYNGSLGSMSLLPLNKWLEREELTRIKEGTIDSVAFSVDVKNGIALVKVTPLYHNLVIKLLDKDDWGEKTIPSFIANIIKIKKSNPEDDKQPMTANVPYIKNKDDTFLDLVWNSLKKGLGNVVGF